MPQSYDVIVVGSGAGGATAALVLVNAAARVLLLEAGRMLTPATDFLSHEMPWDLKFRGEGPPGKYDGLWKINEYTAHLYTNPREDTYDALDRFHWTRLRAVGGRTNTWGRSCFRHGPLDFGPASVVMFSARSAPSVRSGDSCAPAARAVLTSSSGLCKRSTRRSAAAARVGVPLAPTPYATSPSTPCTCVCACGPWKQAKLGVRVCVIRRRGALRSISRLKALTVKVWSARPGRMS